MYVGKLINHIISTIIYRIIILKKQYSWLRFLNYLRHGRFCWFVFLVVSSGKGNSNVCFNQKSIRVYRLCKEKVGPRGRGLVINCETLGVW